MFPVYSDDEKCTEATGMFDYFNTCHIIKYSYIVISKLSFLQGFDLPRNFIHSIS